MPLDGPFIRRECPSCARQFKWHHGPTEDRPADELEASSYFCPYCAVEAEADQWWTQDQVDYMREVAMGSAMRELADEVKQTLRPRRNKMFTFSVKSSDAPTPSPLTEPVDMMIVQSPCHPWEPIKILDNWSENLHCLVCGATFAIA